jgi:large subunit ribosomal protein L18
MAIKSKKVRIDARERRKIRIRKNVTGCEAKPRLTVFRSAKHTYAQAICDTTGATIVAASTLDKEVVGEIKAIASRTEGENAARNDKKSTKSVNAARAVGIALAKKLKAKNIEQVVFDRNGFLYCGRIKAIADGAREAGLKF